MISYNRILGGMLLVAGTCIGAGMLGFPIATAAGGFKASLLFFVGIWAVMIASALFMLEVSLSFPGQENLISMARRTLGKSGAWIAWICYVSFFYALMTAYTSGGASLLFDMISRLTGWHVESATAVILFVTLFSSILWIGHRCTDWANRFFMVALLMAYGVLVKTALPDVQTVNLEGGQPESLWSSLSLLVTAFGFHLLIPSLKTYLNDEVRPLRYAIIGGSILSLLVYGLWEYVILGLVPASELIQMSHSAEPVTALIRTLESLFTSPWVPFSVQVFSLCALLSSFLGVSWQIFDFFADGLKVQKTGVGRMALLGLTLGVPGILSLLHPQSFLRALHYAGIFAAILLIGFPTTMAWRLRHQKATGSYQVKGGTPLIVLTLLFAGLVLVLEIV